MIGNRIWLLLLGIGAALALAAFVTNGSLAMPDKPQDSDKPAAMDNQPAENEVAPPAWQQATFGGGCFWCTEAMLEQLRGVHKVESGYSGGEVENPTYEQVCSGVSGHAEVVQVTYDPSQISYVELLEAFWRSHDPTTLNRQGNDYGTQYRSVIFYHDDEQQRVAKELLADLEKAGVYSQPIVTEISPLQKFYPAEGYHQSYYQRNGAQPYCAYVIMPKLAKFREVFRDKLKPAN